MASSSALAGCAGGQGARVSWRPPDATPRTYRVAIDGADADFVLDAQFAPANDLRASATSLGGAGDIRWSTTEHATHEPGEPDHAGAGGAASVWFVWRPDRTAHALAETCKGPMSDTILAVYTLEQGTLMPVASADDTPGCGDGRQSRVAFDALGGTPYYIAVDARLGATGDFELAVAPTPVNDNRANATPVAGAYVHGTVRAATKEAGEPDHAGFPGGRSVWYRWRPPAAGTVTIDTCESYSGIDTLLAIYTADGTPVAADDDDCGLSSRVTFSAAADTDYLIAVDAKGDAGDEFTLAFPPAVDVFANAAAHAGETFSATADLTRAGAQPGEPGHDAASAERSAWFAWTPSRSASAVVESCASGARLGVYTGAVVEALIAVTPLERGACRAGRPGTRVRFTAVAGQTYRIAVDSSDPGVFSVYGRLAPINDDLADALELPFEGAIGSTVAASLEQGEPEHAGAGGRASVWYRWTAPRDERLAIEACQVNEFSAFAFPFALALYRLDGAELVPVAANEQASRCGIDSQLRAPVEAGAEYRLAVTGFGDVEDDFALGVGFVPSNDNRADALPVSGRRVVTGSTAFATAEPGEGERAGVPATASVWYRYHADTSGPVTLKTCGSSFWTVLGVYAADGTLITAAADPCRGQAALTFAAEAGSEYLIVLDGAQQGDFELAIGAPANDDINDADKVAGAHVSVGAQTEAATTETGEPRDIPGEGGRSVWWSWTAPAEGPVEINTCGSDYQTVLSVYRTLAVRVAGNVAGTGCGTASRTTFTAEAGHTYLIGVSALDGDGGTLRLQIAPPANDRFAAAEPLDGDDPTATGTLGGASAEDDEPAHAAAGGGRTIWYAWTAPESGAVKLDACDSPTPVNLGIYRGTTLGGLTRLNPQDGCDASLDVTAGQALRIALDGVGATVGATKLTLRLVGGAPQTSIDAGPPAHGNVTTATVRFRSDREGATFECRLDAEPFAPCVSPWTRTELADGAYAFEVRAIDAAGIADPTPARHAFVIDTVAPRTTFAAGPADPTNALVPTLSFSSEAGATFECAVDDGEPRPCESPLALPGLEDGEHAVRVRATDRAGNVEAEPAERRFTIDRITPNTTLTGSPVGAVNGTARFDFTASEDGASFECAIDEAPFLPCRSGEAIDVRNLINGEHTFRVRARDLAGNTDPTPASVRFVLEANAPVAELNVEPDGVAVGQQALARIGGTDPDGDALTYTLDFGDGTRRHGALPQTLPIAHAYARAGLFVVRLEVRDGANVSVVTRMVAVTLAEPLRAEAGDDLVAVAGEPVRFDGGASRPLAGIERRHWTFGDGSTASGATPGHVYSAPGTSTVTLTVEADGQSHTDVATVTVLGPESAPGIGVTVRSSTGPLAGADVLVTAADGRRVSARTESGGRARLAGLDDGSYTVHAYAPGHLPETGTVTQADGSGQLTITLQVGEVAKAEVQSRELTRSEVSALGIDANAPANQNVYEFSISLGASSAKGYANGNGFVVPSGDVGVGAGCPLRRCGLDMDGNHIVVTVHEFRDEDDDQVFTGVTALVMPGRAQWLKEFFEVSMTVHNLATDAQFVLRNGSARLWLPAGLSLAPTARGERLEVPVGDLAGGASARATWVVRGDQEGQYGLSADFGATLEPFGRSVSLRALGSEALRVWGGSALELELDVDETAYGGLPYHVTARLKNVADVPVYNVALEFKKEGTDNFIYQPRQALSSSAAVLAPGAKLERQLIMVPARDGAMDVRNAVVSYGAGQSGAVPTVTTHPVVNPPRTAPQVEVSPMGDRIGLTWDPVPGATGYAVYSTSNRETHFLDAPDPNVEMLPDYGIRKRAVVRIPASSPERFYAISPVVDGRPLMSHPLTPARALGSGSMMGIEASYDWPSKSEHMCALEDRGVATGKITFTLEDPFFGIEGYRITTGTGSGGGEPLVESGLSARSLSRTVTISVGNTPRVVSVTIWNDDGDSRTWTETFDALCDTESAVVVAMGVNSSLSENGATVVTRYDCEVDGLDAFNRQAATNSCDGLGHPTGNLISYLQSLGYDSGTRRSDPNRTLLEFSYKGARVTCDENDGPRFEPTAYSGLDSWLELRHFVTGYGTSTAERYLDALLEYDRCWRLIHGRALEFAVVGHSLGGYQAFALGRAAASRGVGHLLRGVVAVDGAIHAYIVGIEFVSEQLTHCLLANPPAPILLPIELWEWLRRIDPFWQFSKRQAHAQAVEDVRAQIQSMRAAGIRTATVTNHFDPCLTELASINEYADDVAVWRIKGDGWSGPDLHSAALKSHPNVPEDAGFPLATFLTSRKHVPVHGIRPADAVSATRVRSAVAHDTGVLAGQVRWAGSGAPVTSAQVVAIGADTHSFAAVGDDGAFAIEGLSPGAYKVRVTSIDREAGGAWAGGATVADAAVFTVGMATVDVGTIELPRPVTTTVTVTDAAGAPLSGASAMLLDDEALSAGTGTSGPDGRITLTAPSGRYTLITGARGARSERRALDATTPANVQVTLAPALEIDGTFKDADGDPLPGVVVALYTPGGEVASVGLTGIDGTHTFGDVNPGDYQLRVFEALGRFELPDVRLPVAAGGAVAFQDGVTPTVDGDGPPAEAQTAEPYAFTFSASGALPRVFSLASGTLPPGLTLAGDGRLAGTPLTAGEFTFTIRVANAGGATVSVPFTITVTGEGSAPDTTPPVISGVPASFAIDATSDRGAVVEYATPTAADDTDGAVHVACTPPTGTLLPVGMTTVRCTAADAAGNSAAATFTITVRPLPAGGAAALTGTVPPTLSLTLDGPVSFGTFAPGLERVYQATSSLHVTSTGEEAEVTVITANPRLRNGAHSLAAPLELDTGTGFATISDSLVLRRYPIPVTRSPLGLTFRQRITASEPLRTGRYTTTATFTLSTVRP